MKVVAYLIEWNMYQFSARKKKKKTYVSSAFIDDTIGHENIDIFCLWSIDNSSGTSAFIGNSSSPSAASQNEWMMDNFLRCFSWLYFRLNTQHCFLEEGKRGAKRADVNRLANYPSSLRNLGAARHFHPFVIITILSLHFFWSYFRI